MVNLKSLINRWKRGEDKAAEEIYNLHQTRVYRLAFGLLGNPQDAEEAALDALVYALMNIHHYDDSRSAFPTWLHMITVSRCRDILRKRRLPMGSISGWLRNLHSRKSEDPSPEQQVVQAEDRDSVWSAIKELSPVLREAIVLRHWGGNTYQEIADIVGCPIRTAQSRVRLAYGQLQRTLNKTITNTIIKEISE